MQERSLKLLPGWGALAVLVLWVAYAFWFLISGRPRGVQISEAEVVIFVWMMVAVVPFVFGFKINGPNMSLVIQLFGVYVGTIKTPGFYWGNPFYWPTKVSMRVRTFETDVDKTEEVKNAAGMVQVPSSTTRRPLKVNDKDGTPIEIAAVVVWRIVNPTDAVFEVDKYEDFVKVQSDAALRSLACHYSYDAPDSDAHSLRGHIDEVAQQLRQELQDRMGRAGVEVLEARISKLAYATEIAAAMLLRQQAGAVIAARARIVEGAVGMVEHALELLASKNVVELDPERKATMVSNLLVVLCGHSTPQPVINAGSLHN